MKTSEVKATVMKTAPAAMPDGREAAQVNHKSSNNSISDEPTHRRKSKAGRRSVGIMAVMDGSVNNEGSSRPCSKETTTNLAATMRSRHGSRVAATMKEHQSSCV